MIPSFLRSLAALLRRLISEGGAVHCTEADAAELEMLAGIFEKQGPVLCDMDTKQGGVVLDTWVQREVSPADIAFGWLRLARVRTVEVEIDDGRTTRDAAAEADVERAAVCAELALLAAHWQGCTAHEVGIWAGGCEEQSKRIWMAFPADAHQGTIEGCAGGVGVYRRGL